MDYQSVNPDNGKSLAARAETNLEISSMELGGSDAFIVLDDADLEHAVKWAAWGRMYNAGQTCCAAKRVIVVESIADVFLEKFVAECGHSSPATLRTRRRASVRSPRRPRSSASWRRSTSRPRMARGSSSANKKLVRVAAMDAPE